MIASLLSEDNRWINAERIEVSVATFRRSIKQHDQLPNRKGYVLHVASPYPSTVPRSPRFRIAPLVRLKIYNKHILRDL
jgi:hypothetical protein